MTFSDMHNLVTDDDLSEDMFGVRLSAWLTDRVDSYGTDYSARYSVAKLWDAVAFAAEHAALSKWPGVGVMLDHDWFGVVIPKIVESPEQDVHDEPNHGYHTCTWLARLAMGKSIQADLLALEDRTPEDSGDNVEGEGWLFSEGMLFFNPMNLAVRKIVEWHEGVEELAFYEDGISALEAEYLNEITWPHWWDIFKNEFDETITEEMIRPKFLEYETSPCVQCYVTTRPETYKPEGADACVKCVNTTYTMHTDAVCSYCR